MPACPSGSPPVGVGIAFDGTKIYLSCWLSDVLQRVSPADGSSLGPITIAGAADIDAMAYDGSRGKIWACNGGSSVVLINLTALTATPQFTSNGCFDGLAYDGSDDTLWASCDACSVLYHYSTAGAVIGPPGGFAIGNKLGGSGNSGIAVGGTNLYLGNDGGS